MGTTTTGGLRDSEWFVVHRCLALIRRLLRGSATKADLIKAVRDVADVDTYVAHPETKRISAFEQDINRRLRDHFEIVVRFNRHTAQYELVEFPELPGFDMPDEALAALAFLEDTFQPGTPHAERIAGLLEHLIACLPQHRRQDLQRQRVALRLNLRQLDSHVIPPAVEQAIERAVTEKRQLRFRYLSPSLQVDGLPRVHTVEPYRHYFDSVWGHRYLYAFCRHIDGPDGSQEMGKYIRYRTDRIQAEGIQVLETKLGPFPPRPKSYSLVYRLAPAIARRGDVSPHFPEMQITPQEDGSAIVQAITDDLFFALRTLLHYGPNCEVLGGPEALREMHQTVQEMAKLYETS